MTKAMMMLAASAALVCGAGTAAAQSRGSQEDIAPGGFGNDVVAARRSTPAGEGPAVFGKCAVDADRAGATALLDAKIGSGESKNAAKKLADKKTSCGAMIGRDRSEEIVRGAIARQLYTETYAAAPAPLTSEPAPFQGSGDRSLVQYDLASCAVTRDPVAADALVRAAEGSAEERTAFPAVVAAVGRCTPNGAKIGFSKAQLRAGVAEGLWAYRKGMAAR